MLVCRFPVLSPSILSLFSGSGCHIFNSERWNDWRYSSNVERLLWCFSYQTSKCSKFSYLKYKTVLYWACDLTWILSLTSIPLLKGEVTRLQDRLPSAFPIFNAGDGAGEHPSQALLDVFAIQEEFPGRLINWKDAVRQLNYSFPYRILIKGKTNITQLSLSTAVKWTATHYYPNWRFGTCPDRS